MAIYIEYHFTVSPLQPGTEILIAQLGYAGFESSVENQTGVLAYIQKEECGPATLEDIQVLGSPEFEITFQRKEIAQINWNAAWEQNFDPIVVDDTCAVRAPFHTPYNCAYEIIIEPKMSFGTGHHETTFMMLQHILENDFQGKTVLDMGCGTGLLAILAEKKGATAIEAIDIDNWCYLNSLENVTRNGCKHITVLEGDASLLSGKQYDIIIANINRNILLTDLSTYVTCLNEKGSLFLSGFYDSDCELIETTCNQLNLKLENTLMRNHWVALKFVK